MSNTFAPFGFSQVGGNAGAAPNFEQASYPIVYNDANKIYTGDPVKILSTGYIAAWTAGTEVSQLFGIFAGCQYLSTSQSRVVWSPYWPGADVASGAQSSVVGYVVPVSPGSAPRFLVQTSDSSTTAVAVTQADVGQNYDVAMGTGNTLNGRSGAYLQRCRSVSSVFIRVSATALTRPPPTTGSSFQRIRCKRLAFKGDNQWLSL